MIDDFDPLFGGIEDTILDDADKVLEEVYPDSDGFLGGSHTLTEYLGYFRWIVNFLFVGMPWFGVSIAMVIINLIFNIWLNQWWADGNAFLVLNTVYLIA